MADSSAGIRLPVARKENLLVQDLSDETIIYDLDTHRVTRLNRSAAVIWRACDGRTTVTELAARVEGPGGAPASEEMVWYALERLSRVRLLSEKVRRPDDLARLSRREMLRKAGMTAGMAALVPVVHSLIAPTPAEAQGVSDPPVCDASQAGACCCINGRVCRDDGQGFGVYRCIGAVCDPGGPGGCV